jgi:hypothetical protein
VLSFSSRAIWSLYTSNEAHFFFLQSMFGPCAGAYKASRMDGLYQTECDGNCVNRHKMTTQTWERLSLGRHLM